MCSSAGLETSPQSRTGLVASVAATLPLLQFHPPSPCSQALLRTAFLKRDSDLRAIHPVRTRATPAQHQSAWRAQATAITVIIFQAADVPDRHVDYAR
jgi:hypothetical protein